MFEPKPERNIAIRLKRLTGFYLDAANCVTLPAQHTAHETRYYLPPNIPQLWLHDKTTLKFGQAKMTQ